MSKPAVGIDLGTTYSAVAVFRNGNAEIIANDQGNRTTPSCVAFTPVQRIVGEGAIYQAANNPENTVYGVKRLMGRSFNDSAIQDDIKTWPFKVLEDDGQIKVEVKYKGERKRYYPEEISAYILEKMKLTAEEFLQTEVKDVVITCPAYFNSAQREVTKDAAQLAGLNVLRMINEPTAAAMAYGLSVNNVGRKNVLIFDFGGGTFDVSILTIKDKDYKVRATNGDTHFGGEDFDQRMVDFFVSEFKRKIDCDISKEKGLLRNLKNHCERAKKILSVTTKAEFILEGINLTGMISRARFEDLCDDLFENAIKLVDATLRDAEMTKSEIDEVVLVGGSSHIPKIQEMLSEFFDGKALNQSINRDKVFALGAAIQAGMLQQNVSCQLKGLKVQAKIATLTLGIDIGATKIVVAVCRNDKAEVVLNQEGYISTKFCVAFNNKERLFGIAAEGQYSVNPESTIYGRDVKKIIGLRKDDLKTSPIACPLKLEGSHDNIKFSVEYKNRKESLSPEHILAMVLKKVKDKLDDVYEPKTIHAVITVPTMFNSAQRFAVRNAVLASGIKVDSIINDSTATAITYSSVLQVVFRGTQVVYVSVCHGTPPEEHRRTALIVMEAETKTFSCSIWEPARSMLPLSA